MEQEKKGATKKDIIFFVCSMSIFLLVIVYMVSLSAGDRDVLSKEKKEDLKEVVAIVDDVLDEKISADNAYDRIDDISDHYEDEEVSTHKFSFYVLSVKTDLLGYPDRTTTTELRESRNDLAKEVGIKKRKD